MRRFVTWSVYENQPGERAFVKGRRQEILNRLTLYGLKNCDTCRKARKWLDAKGLDYRCHDLRADGLTQAKLRAWVEQVGWEALLNRRGTTWRQLPDADKLIDSTSAIDLMIRYPALIKRPVLEAGDRVLVSFREAQYQTLL